MKKIFLLLFITNLQAGFAQNKKIDSLNLELKKATQDTTRLRIYLALSEICDLKDNLTYVGPAIQLTDKLLSQTKDEKERQKILKQKAYGYSFYRPYYDYKHDTAKRFEFMRKRLHVCQEIKDPANIVNSIFQLSSDYLNFNDYAKAISYKQLALSVSTEMNYKKGIARYYREIASVYEDQGELVQALENYKKSLSVSLGTNDSSKIAEAYVSLGFIYSKLHQVKNALDNFNKGITLYKLLNDKKSIRWVINCTGVMYMENKDNSNALLYYQKSLELSEELKDTYWIGVLKNNIGSIYTDLGDISNALKYITEALEINETLKDEKRIAWSLTSLAKIYFIQKKFKEAKDFNLRSIDLSYKYGDMTNIWKKELLASQIDSALRNGNEAYDHYKRYILISNQLKSEEIHKEAAKEKIKTEYDKQLTKSKAEQDIKDAAAKAESKKQKIIILFVVSGLLILLIFAGFIFRSLRITNKQKNTIAEKNKEILSSIEYALRIQTAILPPQKTIKQYLQDSFILYKPKDIVAGDFYWMETADDLVLFAACDCTGHGVPGAMVSVVCYNALNRAIREFGLRQPAAILDKTAEIVIENFSKSEEDIKDGMDISLCAYNIKTKILEWAGANNPLWLLQNGELTETKANKQPIGVNENSKPFTNHTFTLKTGETIYLFTDGYADQFGGETKQKKLTKKRFKDLILSIQNKSLHEQGIALDKFIKEYRKQVEQIDDILVMGVKI